jgi:hypothetical protein
MDKMVNVMDIIHITGKGIMMNTTEKYYIYRETKIDNQINDKLTVQPNAIFETLVQQQTQKVSITRKQQKKINNPVIPEQ